MSGSNNENFTEAKSVDEILDSVRNSILADDEVIELTRMIKPPSNKGSFEDRATSIQDDEAFIAEGIAEGALQRRVEEILPNIVQAWLDQHLLPVVEQATTNEAERILQDLLSTVQARKKI